MVHVKWIYIALSRETSKALRHESHSVTWAVLLDFTSCIQTINEQKNETTGNATQRKKTVKSRGGQDRWSSAAEANVAASGE